MFADASGIFPFPLNGMHVLVGIANEAREPALARRTVSADAMQHTCGGLR
jgi:hypothetical protein